MIDNDLTYFLAIASTGTLASAAAQLGISQPAVTKASRGWSARWASD
jgi:DNA-binding transcriptional LysR family regulator